MPYILKVKQSDNTKQKSKVEVSEKINRFQSSESADRPYGTVSEDTYSYQRAKGSFKYTAGESDSLQLRLKLNR